MKTFVVSAVSIVLVSILFCPMVMSAPSMPNDVQMVQPDPSLPKELAAFWGKWDGLPGVDQYFLIVEKIDEQKASIYIWREGDYPPGTPLEIWTKHEAKVIMVRGKYILSFQGPLGDVEYTMKGDHLASTTKYGTVQFKRVP